MTNLEISHKQHRRTHSNSVSGVSPPEIDTRPHPESTSRRNSEGSSHLVPAPPINIHAASPITPSPSTLDFDMTQKDDHRQDNKIPSRSASPVPSSMSGNGSELYADNSSTLGTNHHSVSRLFRIKPRSRRSSVSQQSATESIESANKPRCEAPQSSDETQGSDRHAGSTAAACSMELANAKRNHDFHVLFRSVPEEDPLIEDFGCALQKEILLQGRVYISEKHICFNANIFGWITNLVIAFSDITEIEKKTTALFIPNAIQISTEQSKHFLASFLSRDQAYDMFVDVWNKSKQPHQVKESDCEDDADFDLGHESDASSDSGSYTGSEDDDEPPPLPMRRLELIIKEADRQTSLPVLPLREQARSKETNADAARRRAISEAGPQPNYSALVAQEKNKDATAEAEPTAVNGTTTVEQTHEKTECNCLKNSEHFNKVVYDQMFPCSIEVLYNLLYQSDFVKKFLVDQKNTELTIGEWQKGEGSVELVRELSYIKPLNGPIGPKSTKCLLTEEVLHLDLNDYVTQMTTTRTPDVPSGGSFCIRTRSCLMWAGLGQVRMLVTVLVDFQKSSWIKGPIESASISGQESYYNDLDAAIRAKLFKKAEGAKAPKDRKKRKHKGNYRRHKETDEVSAKEQQAKEPQSVAEKTIEMVSEAIGWVVSNGSVPSATQISVLCMILLVIINLFIANKMAQVDHQLAMLKEQHTNPAAEATATAPAPNGPAQKELWDWLSKIDPEHRGRNNAGDNDGANDVWAERFQASRLAKVKLDRHMEDLEQMIQRAGSNMEQVTKMVDQQRQRIQNSWRV